MRKKKGQPHNNPEGLEHQARLLYGHIKKKREAIYTVLQKLSEENIEGLADEVLKTHIRECRELLKKSVRPDSQLTDYEHTLRQRETQRLTRLLDHCPALLPDELRICDCLLSGMSTAEISAELFKSEKTIDRLRLSIRRKLHVPDGGKLALLKTLREIAGNDAEK